MPVSELAPDARQALRREILRLADSKRVLGIHFSDWLLGAPSIEAGIAASAMAQDEWGHARLLYAMLKDFDEDPLSIEHDRGREEYASISALDDPLDDWADWVATVVVVDGALTTSLEGLAEGCYETARGRIPKMLAEEGFHWDLGCAWLGRLARGSDEARSRVREEVTRLIPIAARFVAPGDETARCLEGAGLALPQADRADRYRGRMAEALSSLFDEGELDSCFGKAVTAGWDSGRGRAEGAPTEDAVARARGDLNRDLFVE